MKKYWLYAGTCFYIVGILLAQTFWMQVVVVSVLISLCALSFLFFRKCKSLFLLALLCLTFGILRVFLFQSFEINHTLDTFIGTKNTFIFQVVTLPHVNGKNMDMVLKSKDGSRISFSGSAYQAFSYGDQVEVSGVLKQIPQGSFWKDKIFMKISSSNSKVLKQNTGNIFVHNLYLLRLFFVAKIYSIFPSPLGELVAGLTVEGSDAISKSLKEEFRRTGLSHIVALSGTNISIVVEAVSILLKKTRRSVRFGAVFLFIILFTLMVGVGSTILRSAIMGVISLGAEIARRKYNPLRALVISFLLMSLWNPYTPLYDVSFQLSCMATLSMVLLVPPINLLLFKIFRYEILRETLATTLSAEMLVTPLILFYSGTFSVVAPLANLLVVPLVPFAMFFGALPFVFSFTHLISLVVSIPGRFILSYIFFMVHFFSGLSFAAYTIHISLPILTCVYVGIVLLLWYSYKKLKLKLEL